MTSRFLTLLLPLLCLGIFLVGEQRESTTEKTNNPLLSKDKKAIEQTNGSFLNRARVSLASERGYHETARALEDKISFPESISSSTAEKLAVTAEEIWKNLPAHVIARLSEGQRNRLSSFLENRLAEAAQGERRYTCFDEHSAPEMAMAHHEVERAVAQSGVRILANQFLGSGKWTSVASGTTNAGAQGNSVAVTWSIVPDGTPTPGLDNAPTSSSNLRAWLSGLYGGSANGVASEQAWFALLSSTFEAMGQRSGMTFIYEPNDDGVEIRNQNRGIIGTRGDIRISARTLDDEGDPVARTNTLGFAYAPDYGEIILDSADSFFENQTSDSIGFFNTLTHELGHAIGLAHVCPVNQTKLMEPLISRSFRGPQFDEFYSLQRQYGDELEIADGESNNNSVQQATPLTLDADDITTETWLSIDNNSDIDYFSFPARQFDQLQATVDPGSQSYLEGPQTENCTGVANFIASSQQKLTIDLLDQNGITVLASANSAAIGEAESLLGYEFETDGTYYLRINGGNTNSSQIYSLSLEVSGAPPEPSLSLTSQTIIAESSVVKNSRIDAHETVKIALQFENSGDQATDNLTATFDPVPGVTFFTPEVTFPEIAVGESGTAEIILAVAGNCGRDLTITMNLSDGSGYENAVTFTNPVGEQVSTTLMSESFEAAALPSGWSTSITGAGINWVPSTVDASAGSRSAFADNVSAVSTSTLISPSFTLGDLGATLRFSHSYDHETRWDGGVLEASLDDGDWFDLPQNAAVTVISNGYSDTMRPSSESGLAGRLAWTGDSNGFVESAFQLPEEWAGQEVRFRWFLGHDASVSEQGWLLDDITLLSSSGFCEPHRPELEITANENTLVEGSDSTDLQLTSALPLLDPITVTLLLSGNGDASDVSGLTPLTLPAGETTTTLTLSAVAGPSIEESETLTLSIPGDAENFAPGASASVTFTIIESSSYETWSAQFFQSPQSPEGDADKDGWSTLAEYLLGQDPSDASSRPDPRLRVEANLLTIALGALPDRSDATLGVEVSSDLQNWSAAAFTKTAAGLELARTEANSYLRLTFTLNP
ncbi:MAG: matrixin family metalloprotease [Akkermansiaceae bacterium]